VTIGILVDVNVGQNRCGVTPGADAVALGQRVVAAPMLRLRGLMGYEGHAVGIHDRGAREAETRRSMDQLVFTARMFRDAGLPTEIVSTGGTGTFDIGSTFDDITEIQAGSYALMDTDYGKLGLPFEYASYVMGTVISRPTAERCVADCGHKSCTKDHGHPDVRDIQGASVTALNDEHAVLSLPPDSPVRIGDRIFLIPSHTDPTLNLHDVVYVLDGDAVVDVWPVLGRGYR
jgi:D-serine deaminase-like pyridoxal phosphate-dependent protein